MLMRHYFFCRQNFTRQLLEQFVYQVSKKILPKRNTSEMVLRHSYFLNYIEKHIPSSLLGTVKLCARAIKS